MIDKKKIDNERITNDEYYYLMKKRHRMMMMVIMVVVVVCFLFKIQGFDSDHTKGVTEGHINNMNSKR